MRCKTRLLSRILIVNRTFGCNSTLFSVFGNVVKHVLSGLIYHIKDMGRKPLDQRPLFMQTEAVYG